MMRVWIAALLLLMSAASVRAADVAAGTSLMLAAIVAQHSPDLNAIAKRTIARLADGNLASGARPSPAITVTADGIACRASNVDITARSCEIRFAHGHPVPLRGRAAGELIATLTEAGVASDGAAGTTYTGLGTLNCVVDPDALRQKAGGGAMCTFEAAAG